MQADMPQPLLLADVISMETLCTGTYRLTIYTFDSFEHIRALMVSSLEKSMPRQGVCFVFWYSSAVSRVNVLKFELLFFFCSQIKC